MPDFLVGLPDLASPGSSSLCSNSIMCRSSDIGASRMMIKYFLNQNKKEGRLVLAVMTTRESVQLLVSTVRFRVAYNFKL